MSIEKLKGLKGLKGLSNQEYNDWKNEQIKAGYIKENTDFETQQKLYDNLLYVERYGKEGAKLYSYEERKARYKEDVLKDAVLEKYAGDPNLSDYMTLSSEGMEELMLGFEDNGKFYQHENLYSAEARRQSRKYKDFETYKKAEGLKEDSPFFKYITNTSRTATSIASMSNDKSWQEQLYEAEVNARENQQKKNKEIYDTIKARDLNRLQEKAKPKALEIQKEMLDKYDNGELSYDTINEEFYMVTKHSNYYNAFADAKELENYTIEQKIADIANHRAITEFIDSNTADEVINQRMRNYISDTQSGWKWAGNTAVNVGVGGVAHLANTALGYYALAAAIGEDGDLNSFLQGKRKDGSDLPNWINPQYWNGVDQFNTFSGAEIKRARENGGVSKYNNITRSGEDLDFWNWNTLNEGLKMGKYLWSNALLAYLGGVGSNYVATGFGATFTKSIWNPTTMLTQGLAKKATTAHAVGNVLNTLNTAVPMSFSMGVNKYNDVKTSAYESIDKQVDKAYQEVIKNTSLSNEEIKTLVDKHLTHPEIVEEIENRIQELKQSSEYKENKLNLSDEELKKLVTEQVRTSLMQNPMHLYEYYNGNSIKQTIRDSYNNDYTNAELAATKAFQVQATISGLKEAFTNQMLRGYLFSKGNRLKLNDDIVKNIKVGNDGFFTSVFNPRIVLALGKQMGGEFTDEWFDAHSEHFSEGFGLGWFNNVTQARYNPEFFVRSQSILGNFLSGIDEGWKQLGDQFWDKAGIYEGLIGAISPFTSVSPNIGGIVNAIQSRKSSEENQEIPMPNMHWSEKISQYITNPLISSIAEEYQKAREINEEVEIRNQILKENSEALLDISEIISTFNEEETAVLSHDLRKAKDAKLTKAFNTIWALKTMAEDELYSQSSIVKNALSTLQTYAKGEADDAAITQFLGQAENKKYANDPNAREIAKDHITRNAEELIKYQEEISKYEKMLNETSAGKELNPLVKKQLIFNKLFDTNVEERLNALEREISGNSHYSTVINSNAEFSSEEGFKAVQRVIQDELDELDEKIQEVSETLNKNPKDKAAKLAYDSLQEKRRDARDRFNEMHNHNDSGFTVLSKEEILRLSPIQREKMLNPENLKLYSEEQQKVIKETLTELRLKDPNIFAKLQDAAILQARKEANRKAFIRISDNQELYANYIKEETLKLFDRSARVIQRMAINEVANSLEGLSYEEAKDVIMSRGYSSSLMKAYVKDKYVDGNPYEDIISVIEFQESANSIINTKFNGNKALKLLVYNASKKTSNPNEAMTALEEAVDKLEGDSMQSQLEDLLVALEQSGQHRDAYIINTRQERKAREAELEEKRKLEEEAKKRAQNQSGNTSNITIDESGVIEDVPLDLSPSLQEQSKQDGVSKPQSIIPNSDEGNPTPTNDSLEGLIFPEFNNEVLINDGYLVSERNLEHSGYKTEFYKFLDERNVDLQGIIDFELSSIIEDNPDTQVHFMMVKQNENANSIPFLVIEYNDSVKKHHKEERGGVITSGGKQWLIIGHASSSTQDYINLLNTLKRKRFGYFNYNPNELYYVSDAYTQIKEIGSGRRVRRLEDETETKQRKISELLYSGEDYNEERNPNHLGNPNDKGSGYLDLMWAIQKSEEFVTIGVDDNKEVIPLSVPTDNQGAVFLLIPTTNGKLLPVYINPVNYDSIKDSKLGDRIKTALTSLTSRSLEERKKIKDQLRQYLVFTEENDILIGNEEHPTISIKVNNSIVKTFTLDANFSLVDFLKAVETLNPRINVTASVLKDPTMMELYDEAGALTTDIAYLHTRNGSFTTYMVNDEGRPIITDTPKVTVANTDSFGSKQRRVAYNGTQYSLYNDSWRDSNDVVVTDIELIKELEYLQLIQNRTPDYKSKAGEDYYVIDSNSNNPIVVKYSGKKITIANKEQSIKIIELINKIKENEAKVAAAEAEFVDLGIEEEAKPVAVSPQEQLLGNFEEPIQETINTPTQKPVEKTYKDANKAGENSLENLLNTNNLTTFTELMSKTPIRMKLKKIFKDKGWTWTNNVNDLANFLTSHNINIVNIIDVDIWLDIIKNCR